VDASALALTALLQASRGTDGAEEAATAAAEASGDDTAAGVLACAAQAQVALNKADLDGTRRAMLEGLDALAGSPHEDEVVSAVALAHPGLRIEADRARLARARGDRAAERAAIEAARALAARTLDLRTRSAAAAVRQDVARAHRALCEAELARAEGRSDPDLWRRAADASAADSGPHLAAYARWREAEAVLASRGGRARAADALAAGHAVARDLGAVPLCRDIEALARRARIELRDEPSPAAPPAAPESELATVGLTSREVEVLRLLAAGYTNPQIGEALYISRKTASHHVSSILAKLGVTTRVEAAGVAQRLGLVSDTAAPKWVTSPPRDGPPARGRQRGRVLRSPHGPSTRRRRHAADHQAGRAVAGFGDSCRRSAARMQRRPDNGHEYRGRRARRRSAEPRAGRRVLRPRIVRRHPARFAAGAQVLSVRLTRSRACAAARHTPSRLTDIGRKERT
jgi:DNA-binding CsgD family transcriptional regulator